MYCLNIRESWCYNMPIKVQGDLPAKAVIERENIFIMDETRAISQDIRPLQIAILNLMPLKHETEIQLLRALSNTPIQVDVTFVSLESHVSKNTPASHLNKFYSKFSEIKDRHFDGDNYGASDKSLHGQFLFCPRQRKKPSTHPKLFGTERY